MKRLQETKFMFMVFLFFATIWFGAGAQAQRPVLAYGAAIENLGTGDPHWGQSSGDRTLADLVFNGLIRFAPGDSTRFEPDLAISMPESALVNGVQTWTIEIRQDVQCHAGPETEPYQLTSEDIVYSFEKAQDPERSAYAGDYVGFSIEAVDTFVVRITASPPVSATLFYPKIANYQGGFVVCARAVEAVGDEGYALHPVGTGAFKFESWQPQVGIELSANDDYFRGQPQLAGINFVFMPNTSGRTTALQNGEVHVARGIPESQWIDSIDGEEGLVAEAFGPAEVFFFTMDVTAGPLSDRRVRQAIAHAVSRDDHVAMHGEEVAEKVYSVVPAQYMQGGLTEDEARSRGVLYDYDPARALELLSDAGYANGFETSTICADTEDMRKNCEVLQAELAQVGINLRVQIVDVATYHSQVRQGASPITLYPAWRPNADLYLTHFFHSSSIVVTGAAPITNFAKFSGADELIEEARREIDPVLQAALWEEANAVILEEAVAVPIFALKQVFGRASTVDYGHELVSVLALYPQFTERTTVSP